MSACGKREKLLELFKITSAASGNAVAIVVVACLPRSASLFPNLV